MKTLLLYTLLEKILKFIKSKIVRLCPVVYSILSDQIQKWPFARTLFGYIVGVVSALFFWKIFIVNLELSLHLTYIAAIVLILLLGPGFAFSMQIRSIVCLVYLGCLGKSGRSYLKALFCALIISGPVTNLTLNVKEVVQVFACATLLTYNLTKTRFDLMTKPFSKAVLLMKDDMHVIKEALNEIDLILEPVRSEIEDDDIEGDLFNKTKRHTKSSEGSGDEPSEFQIRYEQKVRRRCELQFEKGKEKCADAFAKLYDKCLEAMPVVVNYLLCWPMKIDFMCEMSSSSDELCDPRQAIGENFSASYVRLKQLQQQFVENTTNVRINYTVINPKQIPGVISAQETGRQVMEGFDVKLKVFQFCIRIINRILAFIFLRLIYNSVNYNNKYLSNVEFDNFYITNYFRKIDERRKLRSNHSLLPLKKFERDKILDPEDHSVKTRAEKSKFFIHMLKFVVELPSVLVFLLLDYILYYMLQLIRKHSQITYHQRGSHNIQFHINGTGLIAKLLRSSLLGFNTNEKISTYISNEFCLPQPTKLGLEFYIKFWGLVVLIIILIYHEILLMRTRRLVCSYFYPQREKKRTLHLYNAMLKRRRIMIRNMRDELIEKCLKNKVKQDMNLFLYLRLKFPRKFGFLVRFECARRECLICNELEPIVVRTSKENDAKQCCPTKEFRNDLIVECQTENCKVIHCKECWRDVGEICLACHKLPDNLATI